MTYPEHLLASESDFQMLLRRLSFIFVQMSFPSQVLTTTVRFLYCGIDINHFRPETATYLPQPLDTCIAAPNVNPTRLLSRD